MNSIRVLVILFFLMSILLANSYWFCTLTFDFFGEHPSCRPYCGRTIIVFSFLPPSLPLTPETGTWLRLPSKVVYPSAQSGWFQECPGQSEPLRLNIWMLSEREPCSSAGISSLKYHNKLRIVGKLIMLLPLHTGNCALEWRQDNMENRAKKKKKMEKKPKWLRFWIQSHLKLKWFWNFHVIQQISPLNSLNWISTTDLTHVFSKQQLQVCVCYFLWTMVNNLTHSWSYQCVPQSSFLSLYSTNFLLHIPTY